jgi:hypothetical protein
MFAVSAITTTRNLGDKDRANIRRAQSLRPRKHIIIDNGSTAGTRDDGS